VHFSTIFHFFSPAAGKIEMTLCPLKDGGQPKQTPDTTHFHGWMCHSLCCRFYNRVRSREDAPENMVNDF